MDAAISLLRTVVGYFLDQRTVCSEDNRYNDSAYDIYVIPSLHQMAEQRGLAADDSTSRDLFSDT